MKKKILVTGSSGLVGSAVQRLSLKYLDKYDFVFLNHSDGDLRNERFVEWIFSSHVPDYVLSLAAKVGGIGYNAKNPANLLRDNLLINTHIIHYASVYKIKKLIACSSICAFPETSDLILNEKELLNGPIYHLNESYGWAKRTIDILSRSYRKQYGLQTCTVIPGNLVGENDYYNLENSHLLPSLILKLYQAKKENKPFEIWGDGTAKRSLLLSDDLTIVMLRLLDEIEELPERLVVGSENHITIKEIVEILYKVADFCGEIVYNTNKPNGQMERKIDISLLKSLFPDWKPANTEEAIKISWDWFEKNWPNIRT